MKIYTKAGDEGTTGLLGPGRIPKDDPRLEAYGTLDELNAVLGVARASGIDAEADAILGRIQSELFDAGASLADPDPNGRFHGKIGSGRIEALEAEIDAMEERLDPLTSFILPGGTPAAAQLHLARTVCRRTERAVVYLGHQGGQFVAPWLIPYLNRLSDHLFVLARAVNRRAAVADIPWHPAGP
ncbi:MAG: cob(I)yrinic acid a,c-diamide adenosyltransferase [Isosphaeraceae bacterium]